MTKAKVTIEVKAVVMMVLVAIFLILSLFVVIATGRWAFDITGWHEMAKAAGAWVFSFATMQGWLKYILRRTN